MRSNLATALCLAAGLLLCPFAATAQNDDRFVHDIDTMQRKACTPDVQRMCNDYVPDVTQIVACLKREKANLSPACTEVFATPVQCKSDVQTQCKEYLVVIPSVTACLKRGLDQGNLEADCAQAFAAMEAPAPAQKSTKKPPAKKKTSSQ